MSRSCTDALRVLIFRPFRHDLLGAFQTSQSFGQLRADLHHLHNRGDQKHKKKVVGKITAGRKGVGRHLTTTDVHGGRADHSEQYAGGKPHQGRGSQRPHDVLEQPPHAAGENLFFALFSVVSLDDPHAAQGFGEPSGNFSVDLASFAEDRSNDCECPVQSERKTTERTNRNQGQRCADAQQQGERNAGSDQASRKIDQTSSQQIANALDVAHDAGHQGACFIRVVKRDRKARDMYLHLLAKVSNQALGRLRQQLSQRERSNALDERRQ